MYHAGRLRQVRISIKLLDDMMRHGSVHRPQYDIWTENINGIPADAELCHSYVEPSWQPERATLNLIYRHQSFAHVAYGETIPCFNPEFRQHWDVKHKPEVIDITAESGG